MSAAFAIRRDDYEGPEVVARRMHLIVPEGRRKIIWDWLIICFVLYNALEVPFDLAFNLCLGVGMLVVNAIVDACFVFDCLIHFRVTYYDETDGSLVLDYKLVRQHYLRNWFSIDFIASFPFEWLAFAIVAQSPLECVEGESVSQGVRAASLFKVARLLRLGRLLKFFEKLAAAKAFRVGQMTLSLLMVAHWFACIWYAVGVSSANDERADDDEDDLVGINGSSWIHRLRLQKEPVGVQYLTACACTRRQARTHAPFARALMRRRQTLAPPRVAQTTGPSRW